MIEEGYTVWYKGYKFVWIRDKPDFVYVSYEYPSLEREPSIDLKPLRCEPPTFDQAKLIIDKQVANLKAASNK